MIEVINGQVFCDGQKIDHNKMWATNDGGLCFWHPVTGRMVIIND